MKTYNKNILLRNCCNYLFLFLSITNKTTAIFSLLVLCLYFIYDTKDKPFCTRTLWQLYLVTPCILTMLQMHIFDIEDFNKRDYLYMLLSDFIFIDIVSKCEINNRFKLYLFIVCLCISCFASYIMVGDFIVSLLCVILFIIGAKLYRYISYYTIFGGIVFVLLCLFFFNLRSIINMFEIVEYAV